MPGEQEVTIAQLGVDAQVKTGSSITDAQKQADKLLKALQDVSKEAQKAGGIIEQAFAKAARGQASAASGASSPNASYRDLTSALNRLTREMSAASRNGSGGRRPPTAADLAAMGDDQPERRSTYYSRYRNRTRETPATAADELLATSGDPFGAYQRRRRIATSAIGRAQRADAADQRSGATRIGRLMPWDAAFGPSPDALRDLSNEQSKLVSSGKSAVRAWQTKLKKDEQDAAKAPTMGSRLGRLFFGSGSVGGGIMGQMGGGLGPFMFGTGPAGIAAGAALMAGQAAVGALGQGISTEDDLYRARRSMEAFYTLHGGSAAQGDQLASGIAGLSIRRAGIVSRSAAFNDAREFASFHVSPTDTLKILNSAADASLVANTGNEGMNAITSSFTQMLDTRLVTTRLLRQIERSAHIDAVGIIARGFNVDPREVDVAAQNGQINPEKAIALLTTEMAHMRGESDDIAKNSMPLLGARIKETFDQKILASFVSGLRDGVTPSVHTLNNELDTTDPQVKEFTDFLHDAGNVMSGTFIVGALAAIRSLKEMVSVLKDPQDALKDWNRFLALFQLVQGGPINGLPAMAGGLMGSNIVKAIQQRVGGINYGGQTDAGMEDQQGGGGGDKPPGTPPPPPPPPGGGIGAGSSGAAGGILSTPNQFTNMNFRDVMQATFGSQAAAEEACGPIVAAALARSVGVGLSEVDAAKVGQQLGVWSPSQGILDAQHGVEAILGKEGLNAHAVDQQEAMQRLANGQAVGINTSGHYFLGTGIDAQGRISVGETGKSFKGGSDLMTLDQMTRGGSNFLVPGNGFIVVDKPAGIVSNAQGRITGGLTLGTNNPELRSLARRMAEEYGIDPEIFERQIEQESHFNPTAISARGAQGIAQFMPDTARGMGLTDPFDANQALRAAAKYDSENLRQFGNYKGMLQAYNAGPGNTASGKADTIDETKQYLAAILGNNGLSITVNNNWSGGASNDPKEIQKMAETHAEAIAGALSRRIGEASTNMATGGDHP